MTHASSPKCPTLLESPLLVPGAGCLAEPGVWVLSLSGRPVRCIEPRRPGERLAPSPLAVAAAVDAALDRITPLPAEVIVGADVDPLLAGAPWAEAALAAAGRLVERGVRVRLCTRGAPVEAAGEGAWERLLRRAAARGGAVLDLAVFTTDAELARLHEPGAPAPAARLGAAARLGSQGVQIEARVGPMLPWISDTAAHLEALVQALSRAGVRRLRSSYLHVDAHHQTRLSRLPPAQRALLRGCLGAGVLRTGEARLLPKALRIQGALRLARIARAAQVTTSVCRESNPDLASAGGCFALALPLASRPEAPVRGSRVPRPSRTPGRTGQLGLFG